MTLQNYMPMDLESQMAFDRQQQQYNHVQGQNLDQATLARIHSIHHEWSWINPGAIVSFALAGYDAHSPEVAKVAQLALKQRQRDNQFKDLMKVQASGLIDIQKLSKSRFNSMSPQEQEAYLHKDDNSGGGLLDDIGYSVSRLAHGDVVGAVAGGGHEVTTPADVPAPKILGTDVSGSDIAKAGAREASGFASTLGQESAGFIRGGYNDISNLTQGNLPTGLNPATDPYHQSTLGQRTVPGIQSGAGTDIGSGWLPDPASAPAQAAAATARKAAPTIGGHAWTPGRGIASSIFSPDSAPFDVLSGIVDAGVSTKIDPTINLLRANSEARMAQKFWSPDTAVAGDLADRTGLLVGPPEGFEPGTARAFITSPKNAQRIADITANHSVADLWRMTGKRLDVSTLRDLAATTSDEETQQVLLNHVAPSWGQGVAGPFDVLHPGSFRYKTSNFLDSRVIAGMMPERYLQPRNLESTIRNMDDLGQAGHMSLADRNRYIDQLVSEAGNPYPGVDMGARKATINAFGSQLRHMMIQRGTPVHTADGIMDPLLSSTDHLFQYNSDRIAELDQQPALMATIGDKTFSIPTHEELGEWGNTAIQMPSASDVRSATSRIANVYRNPAYQAGDTIGSFFMNEIWKPLHLLRPALALRIIADSQMNLAAAGYQGLFNHPLNYIALQLGQSEDSKLASLLTRADEATGSHIPGLRSIAPSYLHDAQGAIMVDPRFTDMDNLYGGMANIDPKLVALRGTQKVTPGHPLYARGIVDDLKQLASDPVASLIANQADPEAAKEAFFNSPLRQELQGTSRYLVNSTVGSPDGLGGIKINLEDRPGSDQFVDTVLHRIDEKTAGHPDLLEAVRTGNLRGNSLWKNNLTNKTAIKRAQEIVDEEMANPTKTIKGMAGPGPIGEVPYNPRSAIGTGVMTPGRFVPTDIGQPDRTVPMLPEYANAFIPKSKLLANREAGAYNMVIQSLFNHMLTNPDVRFDRIPAYVQSYWGSLDRSGSIERQLPYLSPEDRAYALSNAESANLPPAVMDRLNSVKADTIADRITLHTADFQAKADALDNIVNMVHDLHSRSEFFNMTRLLFPFGDAFRRIVTRWATTAWENSDSLRKFQMGLDSAKSSGFFHKDPVSGDTVFTVPFSDWLTDKTIGVPIPLQSRVKGLSMVGEGIPGVGPVVSIPAEHLIPDTPQFDGIRHLIWPTGFKNQSILDSIESNILPSFADKIINGAPDSRTYASTVGSMMKYLASTGRYDLHGDKAQQETARMLSDAKEDAKWFYVVRGAAQAVLPASPSPSYQIKDKTGHLQILDIVRNDYYKEEQKHGPDKALQWIINHYGEKNIFLAQSFSQSLGYAVPTTKEAYDWVRENPDVKSKYPLTYGLYAPYVKNNKLDITSFFKQFETGERVPISPEDQVKLANTRVGLWQYHQARDKIIQANAGKPLNAAQAVILKSIRDELQARYPGFGLVQFDSTKLVKGLAELEQAASDPKLKDTDAGQGLNLYLAARQATIDAAPSFAKGVVSPFRAKVTKPLRDILRSYADQIIKEHPAFAPMWNEVFLHEMNKDA